MINKNELIKELIMDEGYKTETYEDHLGFLTLGVGHLVLDTDPEIKQPVGTSVSEERILECLNDDIDNVLNELDRNMPWWHNLNDNRQRVLANMCFNLGYPRLNNFNKFLLALKAGKWEEAAEEMLDSKWAIQVGDRAKRLAERMEKGGK